MHWREIGGEQIQATLRQFIEAWHHRHTADATVLWKIRRSPHSVALALLARSGIRIADPLLGVEAASVACRRFVARTHHLGAQALGILARDTDLPVRAAIAGNPSTPPDTLTNLAQDPEVEVRRAVASNKATPAEVLVILTSDPDKRVREEVASNTATPAEILTNLACNSEIEIRSYVIQNPAAPPEVLLAHAYSGDIELAGFIEDELTRKHSP